MNFETSLAAARDHPRAKEDVPMPAPLQVVIAYENPAAGLHALRRLKALLGRRSAEIELKLGVWPMNRLADPEWSDTIAVDLREADLLVLASRGPEPWPSAGEAWLDQGRAAHRDDMLTVMAFPGGEEPWTLTLEGQPTAAAAASPARERGRAA
ncbi:MAG TPA: hypothetical protein VG838_03475 [Opitutaceae bacterium]|nr:hypothetical protein [Opitutaceae bacterium]